MKKITFIVLLALMGSLGFFTSCGSDETEKNLEVVIDGESYSLDGAKLYLYYEGSGYYLNNARAEGAASHKYRDYVLTDGDWNGESFVNTTIYMYIELGVPYSEDYGSGNFPVYSSWGGQLSADSNVGWFDFENDNVYVYAPLEDHDPIKVKGGFGDGETMELSYDGPAQGDFTAMKMYFKGEIESVIGQAPARQEGIRRGSN